MTTRKRSTTASPKPSETTERPDAAEEKVAQGADGGSLLGLFRSGMGLMDSTTVLATGLPRTLLSGFGSLGTDGEAEDPAVDSAEASSPRVATAHGTLDGITLGVLKGPGRGAAMVDDLLGLIKS